MLITEAIPYFLGRSKFGPPPAAARNFKRNLSSEIRAGSPFKVSATTVSSLSLSL